MKTFYKGKAAKVWQIGRHSPQPDWVQEAFSKNYLVWKDNHLLILMAGLQPSALTNLKLGAVGTAGGGFAGYDIYTLGFEGDLLDITNHRIVSARTFGKQYQLIEEIPDEPTERR